MVVYRLQAGSQVNPVRHAGSHDVAGPGVGADEIDRLVGTRASQTRSRKGGSLPACQLDHVRNRLILRRKDRYRRRDLGHQRGPEHNQRQLREPGRGDPTA